MAAPLSPPRLLPSGDSAITVEFSRKIDDPANHRVLALDRTLAREPIAGVTETVPTYRSLLVHYDPAQIDFDALGEKLAALAQRPVPPLEKSRRWRVPVAYGGEHGVDLEDVARMLGITPDEIVARHIAGDYRVAMIGFTPGWSYLSGLRIPCICRGDKIHGCSHRPAPFRSAACRPAFNVLPARAAGICLGCTPVRTYQLHRDPIFLLEPGDRVTFYRHRRQDLRGAGPRGRTWRDHRRIDRRMSKLVISAIGPASSVQDGGRFGAQRYGLTPSGAMDRLGLAAANCLVGNALLAPRHRNRPIRRGFHGARGCGSRRPCRCAAQCGDRRTNRSLGHVHDDRRWRNA